MLSAEHTRAPALEDLRVNLIVQRARAGLSQQELAERSGVGRNTISRIERGTDDVGVDVVSKLALALGTSVAGLFAQRAGFDSPDDDEISRRAEASDDEFIDAETLLDAVDEAAGAEIPRYSRAGRPAVAR